MKRRVKGSDTASRLKGNKRKQPRLWMLFYQVHCVARFFPTLQNTLLHQSEHGKLPRINTPTPSLTYLLLLTAEIFIISRASLERNTLCLQEMTIHWEQKLTFLMRHYSFLTVSWKDFILLAYIFPSYIAGSGDNTVARAQNKIVSSRHDSSFKTTENKALKPEKTQIIFLSCLFVGDENKTSAFNDSENHNSSGKYRSNKKIKALLVCQPQNVLNSRSPAKRRRWWWWWWVGKQLSWFFFLQAICTFYT